MSKEGEKSKIYGGALLIIFIIIAALCIFGTILKIIEGTGGTSGKATSSHLKIGELGFVDNGKDKLNLGVDKSSYDAMISAVQAHDQDGYNELFFAGKIFLVDARTKVRVIDNDWFMTRVRIVEGPLNGIAGWCAHEYVKK